LKACWRKETRG